MRYDSATSVRFDKPLPTYRGRSQAHNATNGYNHYSLKRLHHSYGYNNGPLCTQPLPPYAYPKSVANQTIPSSDIGSQYLPNVEPASLKDSRQSYQTTSIVNQIAPQDTHQTSPMQTQRLGHPPVIYSSQGEVNGNLSTPTSTYAPPLDPPHTDDANVRQPSLAHTHSSPHTPT